MVACAHLKKLTRKEVESLSLAKKGWKKSTVDESQRASSSANILKQEKEKQELEAINTMMSVDPTLATVFKAVSKIKEVEKSVQYKPKSFHNLEKSLNGYQSSAEKFRLIEL